MILALKHKIFIVCTCSVVLSLFLLDQSFGGKAVKQQEQQNVTVLLWHWPFHRAYSLEGDVCREWYGIPSCILTDSHAAFPHADVVVFHHHELKYKRASLPLHLPRPPTQKWLWLSLESPAINMPLAAYDGLFNWTMSYRRDADVFVPYGELVPRAPSPVPAGDERHDDYAVPGNKTHLACWVVSRYRSGHERSKVYQRLKQVVKVQVYGRWVRRPLSVADLLPTISRCYFYLAFENSQSLDYITEKLWRNSFQAGTVPVVLGPPRGNYEALVPADSFIHVDDFHSVEEMGRFLQQLAGDPRRYASYFAWHRLHDVKLYTDWRERLCQICRHYRSLDPGKVYHDLEGWANGTGFET
ncbi:alpha-(1,3)-fucosyltransferase 7 isoform X2 [Conger conger]|uniref:alpha-(1,3)-fucosyltransferase 7 isoform X2 n=1 Tax=Conger conger TaxID=82655 RepID=UPI002A5AB958|nr:alpha-(1,3)-fucosyltransferase 7 isoform X2 [Conger conger]